MRVSFVKNWLILYTSLNDAPPPHIVPRTFSICEVYLSTIIRGTHTCHLYISDIMWYLHRSTTAENKISTKNGLRFARLKWLWTQLKYNMRIYYWIDVKCAENKLFMNLLERDRISLYWWSIIQGQCSLDLGLKWCFWWCSVESRDENIIYFSYVIRKHQ